MSDSSDAARSARKDDPARRRRWPARIGVGRVLRPHGVRGEFALEAWSFGEGALRSGQTVWIEGRPCVLTSVRGHSDRLIGRLGGIDDRDQAETLREAVLEVESSILDQPEGDEVYLFELEGCVVEVEGRAGVLGSVRSVIEDGGGLLLEVISGEEVYLLPFVQAYVLESDWTRGRLVMTLPAGLLDTCVSTS